MIKMTSIVLPSRIASSLLSTEVNMTETRLHTNEYKCRQRQPGITKTNVHSNFGLFFGNKNA